jgi:hypothetical protein
VVPEDVERGTLNWTTWMFPVQWPAVRKQPPQSSINHAVQPTGIKRPERGSVEGCRSSRLPQMERFSLTGVSPNSIDSTWTRLEPVSSYAQTSICTASPLKYAVDRSQRSSSIAFMICSAPSCTE